jgi:4-hydroxybenzoate polyprenyltransferase
MIKAILKNLRIKNSLIIFSVTIFTVLVLIFLYGIQIGLYEIIEIFLVMLFYAFYSFSSNNYFDRNVDINNPIKIKFNPIASGELSEKSSIILNIFLASSVILMSFFWFSSVFLLMILAILTVSIYSYKMKQKPLLDIVFHGLSLLTYFIFPAILFNLKPDLLLIGSLITFSTSNMIEIGNQLEDFESDRKSNIITTVGRFGKKISKQICFISALIFISSLIFLYISFDVPIILVFLISPLYKLYNMRNSF